MKNLVKKVILFVYIISIISCSNNHTDTSNVDNKNSNQIKLADTKLKNIEYATVDYVSDLNQLVVVGEISFDEDNIVRVFPIVSGSVEKVYVSLGDYVKKGQLLAKIVSTDINQYQVDLNIAKTNLILMEKQYKRIKELFDSNFASEKELNEAEKDFKNAQSEFDGKKQLLELYGGSSERNDAIFNVYAPNSGYIVERNINEGTQIRTDNNENMFIISDLKTVWVWANVYESDMAKVKVGDEVSVKTIAYQDKEFKGKINKIGSTLDPEARVVRVRIDLMNEEELLKPEMFATVSINSQNDTKIIAIPSSSIFIENNQYKVIVQIEKNVFEKKIITQGVTNNGFTEIKQGLEIGNIVVSKGALFISSEINNQ